MFHVLSLCKAWGMPYAVYLAQPPEHRALMLAHDEIERKMEAVEAQEHRERQALS